MLNTKDLYDVLEDNSAYCAKKIFNKNHSYHFSFCPLFEHYMSCLMLNIIYMLVLHPYFFCEMRSKNYKKKIEK